MSTIGASPAPDAAPPLLARDWIAGLERGLALLQAFDETHSRMTATDVAKRTGTTRTAARRYLLTLQHLGYVAGNGKLFWLTPRVLRLGQAYLESARLPRIVQPFLQRVTSGTAETAYLSVLDGDDIVFVARNGPNRNMSTGYVMGARVPAQVTAAGMLLLALRRDEQLQHWLATHPPKVFTPHTISSNELLWQQLQRIRASGWALSEQQLDLNSRGIAVPLRDRHGAVLGALSITMPIGQEKADEALSRVLPVLTATAQAMRELV